MSYQEERDVITHTFSTGETVRVPPVSMVSLLSEVRKDYPEPLPPVIKVDFGNGDIRHERNYNDPQYPQTYALWEQTVQLEATSRMLDEIAFHQRLNDKKLQQIAKYREKRKGQKVEENDYLLWFYKIALGTDGEIRELRNKAQRQAEPTPEVVAEKANGFRGDVQGSRRVSMPDT